MEICLSVGCLTLFCQRSIHSLFFQHRSYVFLVNVMVVYYCLVIFTRFLYLSLKGFLIDVYRFSCTFLRVEAISDPFTLSFGFTL